VYKMREGLEEYLTKRGYKKTIELSELVDCMREDLIKSVKDSTVHDIINWEKVSILMQFYFQVFPTGWERVFNELKES
jgi:hypothetical protein